MTSAKHFQLKKNITHWQIRTILCISLHAHDYFVVKCRENLKDRFGTENWWDLQKTSSISLLPQNPGKWCVAVCQCAGDSTVREYDCLNVPVVCVVSVSCPRVRRFFSCCTAANHSKWRSWRNKSHSFPKRMVSGSTGHRNEISVFAHLTQKPSIIYHVQEMCACLSLISSECK